MKCLNCKESDYYCWCECPYDEKLQNSENVTNNVTKDEMQHSKEELVIANLLWVMKELYTDKPSKQRTFYMRVINQTLNYLGVHSYDDDIKELNK